MDTSRVHSAPARRASSSTRRSPAGPGCPRRRFAHTGWSHRTHICAAHRYCPTFGSMLEWEDATAVTQRVARRAGRRPTALAHQRRRVPGRCAAADRAQAQPEARDEPRASGPQHRATARSLVCYHRRCQRGGQPQLFYVRTASSFTARARLAYQQRAYPGVPVFGPDGQLAVVDPIGSYVPKDQKQKCG